MKSPIIPIQNGAEDFIEALVAWLWFSQMQLLLRKGVAAFNSDCSGLQIATTPEHFGGLRKDYA